MLAVRDGLEVYRERPVDVAWKVPAFLNNDWVALRLLKYCEDMGVHAPFSMVYGAPHCAWAGGRPSAYTAWLSKTQLDRYFCAYERFGVEVALTFSRLELTPDLLDDPYCSIILDVAQRHHAWAIVANDELAAHIRSTCPDVRLIASYDRAVCGLAPRGFTDETDFYRLALETYDDVVVRCEFALDDALLDGFPSNLYGRLEVLVNQMCVPNCTQCSKHIHAIEDWAFSNRQGMCQPCYHADVVRNPTLRLNRNVLVSNSRIDQLAARGVTKMKVGGRNAPAQHFVDLMSTYIFEPTGAIGPLKTALASEYGTLTRTRRGFMPYDIPDGILI